MRVIIMRGLPGSGKSTWAAQEHMASEHQMLDLAGNYKGYTYSADHYHYKVGNGNYKFLPENISKAHSECKLRFFESVFKDPVKPDLVIVDNTNTTAWEIAWYWDTAVLFGQQPKIIRIHRSLEWCMAHNTHKVPDKTLWAMYQNLMNEKLPQHWNEEIICPENS